MTPTEIIAALGGRAAVAETVNRPVNTVTYWERRGHIPSRYWPVLMSKALTMGAAAISVEAFMHQKAVSSVAA